MSESDIYDHDGDLGSDEIDDDALIPADGYFGAADGSATEPSQEVLESSPVENSHRNLDDMPRVPNVMVEDPTPSAGNSKREEAQLEAAAANSSEERPDEQQASLSGQANWSPEEINEPPLESPSAPATRGDTYQHHPAGQHRRPQVSPLSTNNLQHNYEAPPAYYPSESPILTRMESADALSPSPTSHSYGTMDRRISVEASTLASGGHTRVSLEEQRPLLAHDEEAVRPESSTGVGSINEDQRGLANKSRFSRRWIQIAISMLFIIFMIILVVLFAIISIPTVREPSDTDVTPIRPPDTTLPPLKWENMPGCSNKRLNTQDSSHFVQMDPEKSLKVLQTLSLNDDLGSGRKLENKISGEIIIQSAPNIAKGLVSVRIETIVNDDRLLIETATHLVGSKRTVRVTSPGIIANWKDQEGDPCTLLRLVINVPPNSAFYNLEIGASSLNLIVRNGVSFSAQLVKLATVADSIITPTLSDHEKTGKVEPYRIHAKHIDLNLMNGSRIQGWYPLYNGLEVRTGLGDIDLQVTPKQTAKGSIDTASLLAAAVAGNVRVTEFSHSGNTTEVDKEALPVRNYESQLQSFLGSVAAKIMMATSVIASAQLGIDLDIIPVLTRESGTTSHVASITTDNRVGVTKVHIREPVFAKDSFTLQNTEQAHDSDEGEIERVGASNLERLTLQTSHNSYKGALDLLYPRAWAGEIKWHGLKGGVWLGYGSQVTRQGGDDLKYLDAVRGDGSSQMVVENEWGDSHIDWRR
ncbi:hypothetical protein VHEMI07201 [[Torrubiella] hemipterigena]|uniref:Adhesin domain-containing protein n=1 Tax=[Torrubiella] hemipterigena TaxID=1531966 RepID=A0A0A1T9M2_9HYPO|nr:hypothetical protein VHEMI07201 [[Torrubiella] hemipterigena]